MKTRIRQRKMFQWHTKIPENIVSPGCFDLNSKGFLKPALSSEKQRFLL
jgi:hypothetical protein